MRTDHETHETHETSNAPGSAREPEVRLRRVLDADGREWRVREVSPSAYDRRSSGSLVFETVDVARRVREFPADWFTRSDAFLLDLNEHPMRRRSDDCW